MLPSGPPWMCKLLQTEYPTKNKIYLYYRDPVECLRSLLRSPLLKDHLDFTPRRLFENVEKLVRVYTEWLSGDAAWAMQVSLNIMTFLTLILNSKLCIGRAASRCNSPRHYLILRQNQYFCDDGKSHCSSPSYLAGKHCYGFSHKVIQ